MTDIYGRRVTRVITYKRNGKKDMGFSSKIRWAFILCASVFIYGSYSVLVHLSEEDGKIPYNSSSIVLLMEIFKFCVSATLLKASGCKVDPPTLTLCLPFAIPAILYFINNNLALHMQMEMDPASYQVLSNLKIVSTAVLYRYVMKRPLSVTQWISLGVLTGAGVSNSYGGLHAKGSVPSTTNIHVTVKGLVMLLVYCTISGLSGVITEYILKKYPKVSLHYQNMYLYAFGIMTNLCGWFIQESSLPESENKFYLFRGFSPYACVLVASQGANGLIMSVIMKHASNITRLFVISCAMLVSTVQSVLIFDTNLNFYFILSLFLVLVALYMYHKEKL